MKKIPTLFVREFENHEKVNIRSEVTPECEWVLEGEGVATEKIDGSCCMIRNGEFFRRYDAKRGKTPPPYAEPCSEPDPVTGHWPHWIPCDADRNESKWYYEAYNNSNGETLASGTYEAVGPHFASNPYNLEKDILMRHGDIILEDVPRTFEGIKEYLFSHYIEGIVFWKDGEPGCKIKRSDFGFDWKKKKEQ